MDMNLPKQRRVRKKKEEPLDPQAAREEAELRMKIQQSLQTQYVDRANLEDGNNAQPANNNNPLMMYGHLGMCGMAGEQDMASMMMNGGMNMQQQMMQNEMMAQQFQQNQGQFNNQHFGMMDLSAEEMAQCMNNAEIKMYEMQLQQKKMLLHQKINEFEMQRQQQTWNAGIQQQQQRSHGMAINGADIMRELRMKQEQLLQMGAAQKHMEEMNRAMSPGNFSGSSRGFSDRTSGGISSVSDDSSFFSANESDPSLARKWYNHQRGVMNRSPQFDDGSYVRHNSNQSAHSQQGNVVDLTDDSRQGMVSPMTQNTAQSHSQQALEMEAMLKQKLMMEMQKEALMKQKIMEEMQKLQSPSLQNLQAVELMMKQKMMQEMQMAQSPSPQNVQAMMQQQQQVMQNQQNNQGGSVLQGESPGKSRELLFAMLNRITSEDTNESGLESLLSMPFPGGGSLRDSLTLGDLQTWLKMKNSTGTADMGFHSVNDNDMSASFNSVMGDSMANLAEENIVTPGVEAEDNHIPPNLRDLSNRTSYDLGTISEDGGDQEAGKPSRISLTVNDLKQGWTQERDAKLKSPVKAKKAPALGQSGKKESLTVGDLKQNYFSKSSGYSHNSGMSLSLGDFGEDILNAEMSVGSVMITNSLLSQGPTPASIRNPSNMSEMMMSMDSMTYSALVHGNDSISELARDLSDVVEGDNESRASTSTDVCLVVDGKPGPLHTSQTSRASSSRSGRSQKRSTASRPSVMSEISQWSNSNPYADEGEENAQDDSERQKSGESVEVAELEALHDSVDFSL
ncbi:hypothetical protein ACHAWO_012346 [Cyclotella atomus]|uniref:Uncharacterized protein n=1 Tax=Cyclotella atomus TaxID=382360 RepID=A0ABD3Q4E6_9STRA